MMKNYRRYSTFLLAFFCAKSLALGLFNVVVDPYEVLGMPKVENFNQFKPVLATHVRLFKAMAITRSQYDFIFLGSSRTELGLDPTHPVLANSGSGYNLALSGPNMYEVLRYFQHALNNQPQITQVVLGIDFFMFNQVRKNRPDFSDARLERQSLTLEETLGVGFSLDALDSSYQTISSNLKSPNKPDSYHSNGRRNLQYQINHLLSQSRLKSFRFSLQEYLKDRELYGEYYLSMEYLKDLNKLVEICQEKNIDLKIFISPSHATQWEAIREAGLWPLFEQWKGEVVQITPVWDFSGYNSITTEPISNPMKYYVDSSHYRPQVGHLVLNRMFQFQEENVPSDFGIFLTRDTLEDSLERIRTNRELWVSKTNDYRTLNLDEVWGIYSQK